MAATPATEWPALLDALRADLAQIRQGGGAAAVERQHAKGRMTARERIAALVDADGGFFELGSFAAFGMYGEWGGAPAASVVCGIARVAGRSCVLIANDATVKAGAFFPMTVKKVLHCQRLALASRLPLIYLVDSAGVFLPLQDEIFPDEDDFGRIFRNNAVLSALGVPQLAAIMGNCVAGGGYLPVLCDKLLMTEGSGLYLAGPALVKSSIGQTATHEELGGAAMHARVSGTIDFRDVDDAACLARLRRLVALLPEDGRCPLFRRDQPRPPLRAAAEIVGIVPVDPQQRYEMRDLLHCLVDAGSLEEYKAEYGQTLVCAYARVGGFPVGIVASQHHPEKSGRGELQFGGVIYREGAEKAARFVMDCNQTWLPVIFLQDVFGFMVGRDSEQSGIIRAGAKLVNAVANCRVPKITVILGGSYGAGHYALCGKAFDPRFLLAWPTARYAVMGANQAASTLLEIEIAALRRQGQSPAASQLDKLRDEVVASYTTQTDVRHAAARGWIDEIIEPAQTREVLIRALEIATRHAEQEPFRTGVLQV